MLVYIVLTASDEIQSYTEIHKWDSLFKPNYVEKHFYLRITFLLIFQVLFSPMYFFLIQFLLLNPTTFKKLKLLIIRRHRLNRIPSYYDLINPKPQVVKEKRKKKIWLWIAT